MSALDGADSGSYILGKVSDVLWRKGLHPLKCSPSQAGDQPVQVSFTVQGGSYSQLTLTATCAQFPYFAVGASRDALQIQVLIL